MTTIICPKCGTKNSSSAVECEKCRIILKLALEYSEKTDAAQQALALHTELENDAPKDLPFWSNEWKKFRSILFIAIAVFIFTLPYSLLSIIFFGELFTVLLNFPIGLFLLGK